jgi:hypothetical protein
MPTFVIAFTAHPVDDSPEQRRVAEVREGAIRHIIESRFPEQRQLARNTYAVDTTEDMTNVWVLAENQDEVYVIPLTGPVRGWSENETMQWLTARLR